MMHLRNTRRLVTHCVSLCVFTGFSFLAVGCVSRSTYEQAKAETQEHTHALAALRENVKTLEQQISGLQVANQREESVTTELRAAIQREEELLPVKKQQAEETLLSLKTQIATLMDESWRLARKATDIRQESATFQTLATRYKHDLEQNQPPTAVASHVNKPAAPQASLTEVPPIATPPSQNAPHTHIAQANPATSSPLPTTQATSSPTVNVDPPSANDSWISIISRWLSSIWKWLFG